MTSARLTRSLAAGALALVAACAPLEPPPQPALPQAQTVPVEYGHRVAFKTDRADLSPGEASRLRRFLAELPAGRNLSARVVGHADQRAGERHNDLLSARRAGSVAAALRSAGVDPVAITLVPMGERLAGAAVDDAPGLARDRQLEVLVATAETSCPAAPTGPATPATTRATSP